MDLNSFQYLAYAADPSTGKPRASMDAFYGPWDSESEFRAFVSVNFPSSIPDGATVAIWNSGKTKLNEYYIYNSQLRLKHDDSQGITENDVRTIVNSAIDNINLDDDIDSAINGLNSDINGKLNTINNKIDGLENSSNSTNNRLSDLESNSTTVNNQLNTINNNINNINNTISDIDIDGINDSVDGKLQKLTNDLNSKIDSDIQELSDSVDDKIANIDVSGGETYDDSVIKNDIKILRNKVNAISMFSPIVIDEDTEENYDASINNHLFVNNELHTESVVHLLSGYSYNIEGTLNGYIVIDNGDDLTKPTYINSYGLTIISNKDSAIKNKSTAKLIIRLTNESITTLVSGQASDEGYEYGTIESVGDLLIQGIAYLIIKNNRGHGINCQGKLKIVEVRLYISMFHHAINCIDDITLLGGQYYIDGIYTSGPQHAICIAEEKQILRTYNYIAGKINGYLAYCDGPNNAYYYNNLPQFSTIAVENPSAHIERAVKSLQDVEFSIKVYNSLAEMNNNQNGTDVGTIYWDGETAQSESEETPNIYYNNESKFIKITGTLDKPLYAPNCTVLLDNAWGQFSDIDIPVITAYRIITKENTYNKIIFDSKNLAFTDDLSQPGTHVNYFQIKDDSLLIISGTSCANDATSAIVEEINGDFILATCKDTAILKGAVNNTISMDMFDASGGEITNFPVYKGNVLAYSTYTDYYGDSYRVNSFVMHINRNWYGFTNAKWQFYTNYVTDKSMIDVLGGYCANNICIKKYQKADLYDFMGGHYSTDQITLTQNIPDVLTFNIDVLDGDSQNTRRVRLNCNAAIVNTKTYTFDVEYKVGNTLYKTSNFATKSAYYAEDIIPIIDQSIDITVKVYKGSELVDTINGQITDTIELYAPNMSDIVVPDWYPMGSSARFKTFSYYRNSQDYSKPMVYRIGLKYTYHPSANANGQLGWTSMKVGETWYMSDIMNSIQQYSLPISSNKNVSGEFGYSSGIRFIVYVSIFNNGSWVDIPSAEYIAEGNGEFNIRAYAS